MMTKSKTTIWLSDQAKRNVETIRAHVGDLTQNATIETSLAFLASFLSNNPKSYADFLASADLLQEKKTPTKKSGRS